MCPVQDKTCGLVFINAEGAVCKGFLNAVAFLAVDDSSVILLEIPLMIIGVAIPAIFKSYWLAIGFVLMTFLAS